MLSLYNQTCLECSSLITKRYSTSFSMGIRVFDKKYRAPIYAIYGFVRFADEIVDTFHDFPKKELLDKFRDIGICTRFREDNFIVILGDSSIVTSEVIAEEFRKTIEAKESKEFPKYLNFLFHLQHSSL